ncbi:acyl-CoA dehydrogenase family protein [Parahaliea mediterranea]|uniref:Acyl-CoA/acyl-ACP dehydrogenase n=1 Tax=Parahaliea mediterranea TaxID=651086 RepID=A0A939IMA6_9GAMM|nr:acyl-CoA dehydrogenase family protein [Parahaliea mediterranea]MBN7796833.1 acyl-CoA/acyl-ACP dehydrogenase [Parahaliea mediterranea]
MDFAYSDDHRQLAELARRVFRDHVGDDYHARQSGEVDGELWGILAETGLLGAGLSEASGGSGLGFIATCLVLKELGAVLAPLPLLPAAVAAMALDDAGHREAVAHFVAGRGWFGAAADPGLQLRGARVRGELKPVPFARGASQVVAVAGGKLVAIDLGQPGIELRDQRMTNGLPACTLAVAARARVVGDGDAANRFRQRLQVATAMLQLGVVEEALARTAAFTVERSQFGQPLARFQAVSQRAADGYIDIEALRATAESAMWRLHAGLDATLEAATALWWAAQAGHRVGHTAQHLHGGIGADVEYPIHRYFLWAKQLEFSQGGAAHSAGAMGDHLAAHAGSGGRK